LKLHTITAHIPPPKSDVSTKLFVRINSQSRIMAAGIVDIGHMKFIG
jgi:hypothetical protein